MKVKLTESQLKRVLNEMRFDGKSTGLFSEEEHIDEGRKKRKSKKKKNTLCARGKRAAKAKYDVYPSAYANGYAVQVCKGKIAGLDGNKKCSGSYCRGKKNESYEIGEIEVVERLDEDLAVWFGTKKKKKGGKQPQGPWVNICRKKKGGGHPTCGRSDSDKGGYPVCRAKSVAANMSQSAKDSACRRKREKEKNDGKSGKGQSPSPIKVKGYKPKKRKSKKNESVNINRMMITKNRTIVSEGLRYHLDNQIPLSENIYRYGSESFFNLINEVRKLHNSNKVNLSYKDEELLKTDIGMKKKNGKEVPNCVPIKESKILEEAEYRGRKVKLNKPTRGDVKKFKVYVKNDKGNVVKVNFGHGGTSAKSKGEKTMRIKKSNPERRKSFRARHNCDNPGPKWKARYWSCKKW